MPVLIWISKGLRGPGEPLGRGNAMLLKSAEGLPQSEYGRRVSVNCVLSGGSRSWDLAGPSYLSRRHRRPGRMQDQAALAVLHLCVAVDGER